MALVVQPGHFLNFLKISALIFVGSFLMSGRAGTVCLCALRIFRFLGPTVFTNRFVSHSATSDACGAVDGPEHRLQVARQQPGTRRRRQRHVQRFW